MTMRPLNGLAGLANPYQSGSSNAPCDLDLARTDYPPLLTMSDTMLPDRSAIDDGYPDATELTATLAARFGVDPDRVLVTAGADDALARIVRAALAPGLNAVVTRPTFEMLPRFVLQSGAELRQVPWLDSPLTMATLLPLADDTTALIAIVTPNNPTGSIVPASELRRIALARPDVVVVVDLAYIDFAEEDPTSSLLELENVVIIRTFSKMWGLASARVGYALAAPPLIAAMRNAGLPYPVTTTALQLANACINSPAANKSIAERLATVTTHRKDLIACLKDLGLNPFATEGNYVTIAGPRARWIGEALAGSGIAARLLLSDAGSLLRITVPLLPTGLTRLLAALRAAVAPEALLLDLDGVLADVSRSYRAAIVDTAAEYGVTVSSKDVQRQKAFGNANDDWQVTHSLITTGGGSATLADVTTAFEARYQGKNGEPGLYLQESLLTSRSFLESLATRLPLAIVTGRPRGDAERFLRDHGIADLFSAVVTREDATIKPNPAPLLLAMKQLGVTRAWMVGDTPDDLTAARACGAIPIGVVAPGEDPRLATATLHWSGAARVLTTLEELLTCLP